MRGTEALQSWLCFRLGSHFYLSTQDQEEMIWHGKAILHPVDPAVAAQSGTALPRLGVSI
jgi:hypothetical protein